MQLNLRVAATTLDGLTTAAESALSSFFGEVEYTYDMEYAQGDLDYDEEGRPVRYQADVTAASS